MAMKSSITHAEMEEGLIERKEYRRHGFGEHEPQMRVTVGGSRASVTFHVGQSQRQQDYARLVTLAGSPETWRFAFT
jgi:hypothetical protein